MPWGLISGEKKLEIIKRPLIPALIFFILGIIIGRIVSDYSQRLYFPLIVLITFILIISFILPNIFFRFICFFSMLFLIGMFFILNAGLQKPRLLELSQGYKKVILEGTVLSPENITQDISKFDVLAEAVFIEKDIIPLKEKVSVTVYTNIINLDPGQRVRFPASLKPFKNFNNPGRYDYEHAMSLMGFSCAASVSDGRYIVPTGKGGLSLFMEAMEAVRGPIRKFLTNNLSPLDQAVYRALILGEMQGISNDIREPFNITGLGHVLSVSGLHIGLVAAVSFFVFKFLLSLSYSLTLRIDIRKIAALITCLCVFAYTFIAGFQVSAKRSMIMAITYMLSLVIGREKDSWSTLSLAAIIVLTLDPNDLYNISFQLSFIAIAGIFWLSPEIYKFIKTSFNDPGRGSLLSRVYIYFSSLLVITFSAVIISLPVTTYYFHRISVIAVPINLIVDPILGLWILPIGLLSTIFLPLSTSFSSLIIKTGSYGLDCMMNIIQFWSHFSWASFWTVTPDPFEIGLCYVMIFFFIFGLKNRTWAKKGLLLILVISAIDISYWIYETRFNPNLRVTFIDVGQGNSALIQFPGNKRLLLDAGGYASGNFDTGKMVVAPFLFYSKIHRIDYIVLSHPHPDHLNGLNFIAEHFDPKEFWYNGQNVSTPEFIELINTIRTNNTKILFPDDLSGGIEIAGVKVQAFHPIIINESGDIDTSKEDSGTNNNSLVLKITYKGISFLFPGDIQAEGEETVVSNAGADLKSDILLVPHHGSRYSSTIPFLQAVRPEISVISCGKGNSFRFPNAETIKRLQETGSKIIRIDESGAVQFKAGSDGLKIKSFFSQRMGVY